jgi:hypothetical protein
LLLVLSEHGQHGGADEIEREVHPRVLVQEVELRSGVCEEYQEGAGNLNRLGHAPSVPTPVRGYATLTTIFP